MTKFILIITILIAILISTPAISGPASDVLGKCMVDSLNGKERKKMAQWMFFAMAAHPEIKEFSKVTERAQDESNKYFGGLINRLLIKDCSSELKFAFNNESSLALRNAFDLVGRVAMQELMTDKNVNVAMTGFEQYLDKEKLNSLAGGK